MSDEEKRSLFVMQEPWHNLVGPSPACIKAKHLFHDCEPMKITRPAEVFDEDAILRAINEYALRRHISVEKAKWLDSSSRNVVILNDGNAFESAISTIVTTFVAAQTDTLNFWYIVGRSNIDCDLAEKVIKKSGRFEYVVQSNGDLLVRLHGNGE